MRILVYAIITFIYLLFPVPASAGFGTGGPAMLSDLEIVFGSLLTAIIPTAGIIFFIMLISGGFKYMTAVGDPQSIAGAWKTITYAIGGLIVTALAFTVIVVIQEVTGAPITQFVIRR